jgi:hypothetical protein
MKTQLNIVNEQIIQESFIRLFVANAYNEMIKLKMLYYPTQTQF